MIKPVYCIYDVEADYYDKPMVFDNERIAVASIRRDIRDMYIRGDVTIDALRDRRIQQLAEFDSVTGEFTEKRGNGVRLSDFVVDLVGSKDEI